MTTILICEEYVKSTGLKCTYKVKITKSDGKKVCKIHSKEESKREPKEESKIVDKQKNKKNQVDFTTETLKQFYIIHKKYVQDIISLSILSNMNIRYPAIPEYISENIIKFAIQLEGDKTVHWNCKNGDLLSKVRGKLECKCFTSDGPISFTPSSEWDEIYFLDARNWLNDRYIVYRVELKYVSDEWKNIKVNKTQTFDDQRKQGRRPRINWNSLYLQISPYCKKIFEDAFVLI